MWLDLGEVFFDQGLVGDVHFMGSSLDLFQEVFWQANGDEAGGGFEIGGRTLLGFDPVDILGRIVT